MTTTDDIRRPIWKVRGHTFLGMGQDQTTAVFCISEQEADRAAAADPATCAAVRRRGARRSFLGLQVELDDMPAERMKELTERAWHQKHPGQPRT